METIINMFTVGVLCLNIWNIFSMNKEINRLESQLDIADTNVMDLEDELRLTTNRYNRKLRKCNKLENILINFKEWDGAAIDEFFKKELNK